MKINKFNENKINHMFLIFILMQPFFDIYSTFFKYSFQILGLDLISLINFSFVLILMICYLKLVYVNRKDNKYIKTLKKDAIISIIYVVIFLVYSILHYWNMSNFDDSIFNRHAYSYVKEVYFIVRCYLIPIMLLYILYRLKISKNTILKAIKISVFIICFVIVITNIFGVSLASYAEFGKLIYIDGSIFHWPFFTGSDNFELYTSKGWFYSANELSAILLSLSPVILYSIFIDKFGSKKEKYFNYTLLFLLTLTMNMLGTRTASLGYLAVGICIFVLFIFFAIIKNVKLNNKKFFARYFVYMLLCVGLFLISPFYNNRYGQFKEEFKERPIQEKKEKIEEEINVSFSEFLKTHCWYYYIEPQLLEIYPVENDEEFWKYLISRDLRLNSNYRIMKTDIYERILERNNNKYDYILGIGYNDILTNEKDYHMQMYYFGIIGVILLVGPFIISLIYSVYEIIRYRKKYFNLEIIIILMGNCIGLIVPYLGGHVFGIMFPMIYIVLNSLLLLTCFERNVKHED